MKYRYLITLILAAAAVAGCRPAEDNVPGTGDPYFQMFVRDDADIIIADLDPMSTQYELVLGSSAWSAAANKSTHVGKAPRFNVKSNLRWKVVPASGEADPWIRPFPDSGEKEGLFFFKTTRNIDSKEGRTSMFNILVNDGNGWEPLEGLLTVTQEPSAPFLEMSAAKFSVEADGQKIRLIVTANVDWSYSVAPSETYGTASIDWMEDLSEHPEHQQLDTLQFQVLPNELGIRGADLTISYTLGGQARKEVIPITQYPAGEADLEGFPVKWAVRVKENTYKDTWPASGTISPTVGSGLITWHNEAGKAADTGGKVVLDVSDSSPRAAGVWPGDYLELVASSPVSAGSIIKLLFATRVSGTGQKYWRLEFRDGDDWKIVGKSFTDEDVLGPDGKPVVYTHAMPEDGATNILVDGLAIYTANTDQVEFRFICAANFQASGAGPLPAPNGGTWRLSVNEATEEDPYQPQISVVAAGAETLKPANLTLTPAYLAFDGKGNSAKRFTVSCNQEFTITPSQSWIHVSATESDGGENLPFQVMLDDNTLTTTREGAVVVKAGITRKEIAIIQGAVASSDPSGDLEPFISVISGTHVDVGYAAGQSTVRVQTNTDVTVQAQDGWLSVGAASSGSASVKEYIVSFTENTSTADSRTGSVRFYNAIKDLESVVYFTQAKNTSSLKVFFQDDFSWLQPLIDEYVKAYPSDAGRLDPVGSNLASHAQPNVWSKYASTAGALILSKGYVDLEHEAGIGNNTLYVQQCYFKMGAGDKQTGLRLPAMDFEGTTPIDVELTFDWCAHMSAAGNIDSVQLVVELTGAGKCADSDAAKSKVFTTTQAKNQLAWQHATLVLKGVTSATRIEIKPDYSGFKETGNHRWHLDNIMIKEISE